MLMASIFTEASMQIAFILVSLTCLKPFLRPFHSGHLITTADANTKLSGYKTTHRGGGRSYKSSDYVMLSTTKDKDAASSTRASGHKTYSRPAVAVTAAEAPTSAPIGAQNQPASPPRALVPNSRGNRGSYHGTVMRQERLKGSSDSEQMFISKTQTWTVEYEDRHSQSRRGVADGGGVGRSRRPSGDERHEMSAR